MNRTGLFIALSLALVVGLIFAIYPELDLKLASLFYDPATRTFPLKRDWWAAVARDVAIWIGWAMVAPAVIALVIKMLRPDRPLLMSGRAIVFMIVTLALSSGVLSNLAFKSHWGRPRPVVVTQFNSGEFPPLDFVAWWDPRGGCAWNCSFFSGEGSAAFWTYAPAALAPAPWRPLAYAAATAFGLSTGVLRMAFGGHFFTDVIAAGIVSFLVVWLGYAFIYRWPKTRLSDEAIDAALTRAFWPGYRLRRRWLGRETGPVPSA
jgi:lipid A 4'-phosphatase